MRKVAGTFKGDCSNVISIGLFQLLGPMAIVTPIDHRLSVPYSLYPLCKLLDCEILKHETQDKPPGTASFLCKEKGSFM